MQYDLLLKRPGLTILLFTLITVIISSQAINVTITSDIEVYMPEGEPSVELLNDIRAEWPIDSLMIYIEADNVTSISALKEMDGLERAMNPEKGGEDGINYTTSIASLVKDTYANFPLVGKDEIPDNQVVVNEIIALLIPDEIKYNLISHDHKNGVIILTTGGQADVEELLDEKIYPMVETTHNIDASPTGMLTLYTETIHWIMERIYSVSLLSLVSLLIVLYLFHRDMRTVFIAILPVVFSIGLTFGTMGLINVEFAPTVISALPLLAALGIAYSFHMINQFNELSGRRKIEAVKKMINTTGKAVFLSAITTIIGFAALLTSTMPPIENMGLAFLIGVFYCFISTMILVPCLLLVLTPRKQVQMEWRALANLTRYRKQILMILAVVSVISLAALPNISSRTSVWEMMPHGMKSYIKMQEYSEKFDAGQSGVILVETPPSGILEPDLLKKLDEMEKVINSGVENASAYSIVDVIKRMNFGRIPDKREEVVAIVDRLPEQYITMMLNEDFDKTLIYVEMPIMPLKETERGVATTNQIIEQYNRQIEGYGSISQLAGLAALTVELNNMLMGQQLQFTFISLILVYLCLVLVFRSFKYASFTMIPILLILMWQPGIFVVTGIPLTVATMTVSSVVIGVGIDFSVHLTERVREEVKRHSGLKAIKVALARKSSSLAEATVTLIFGSLPIFLMEYEMISQFIVLILFMLVFACLAAILALAALYSLRNGTMVEQWK